MQQQLLPQLGSPITNPFGECYYFEINGNAFHNNDSATCYKQHFGDSLFKDNSLHIIIGTDSGLLPKYLLKTGLPSGSHYLFVEIDEVYNTLIEQSCFEQCSENVTITKLSELQDQDKKCRLIDYIYLDSVFISDSLAVQDAKITGYLTLSSRVRQIINAKAYDVIIKLGNRNYIHTQIMNLAENKVPGNLLTRCHEQFSGKTAVILGGGPSLDSFLPWISENQEKIAIFAISRIIKKLTKEDIRPHFIVSIDSAKYNLHISKEMLLLDDGPILINANHVNHQLLSSWKNSSIYLGSRFPWDTSLNQDELSPWGPTVTNTAFGAAVDMGFSNIIMIGVDLCYSQTGVTHASESYEYENGPKLDATITVTTNSGNTAETSSDYYGAIKYLSEQALETQSRGTQVISPCPDAVRIKNIPYLPLEQITISPMEESACKILQEKLPKNSRENRMDDNLQVLSELKQVKSEFKSIIELSTKAMNYCNGFITTKNQINAHHQKMLKQIDQTLQRDFATLSTFTKEYGVRNFLPLKSSTAQKKDSPEEIRKKVQAYFQAYLSNAEALLDNIERAISRVEIRLEEDADSPVSSKIVEQWKRDNCWTRIFVWKKRRPDLQQLFDMDSWTAWDKQANEWLRSRTLAKDAVAHLNSLERVQNKAVNLFSQKDQQGLVRLIDGLKRHPNTGEAGQLQNLVQGYLHETEQNWDLALEAYQLLISEEVTPLVEEALRRIAVLCLSQKNLEMAALAMECLSRIAPSYQPQYADLLSSLGRRHEAADIYTDYLESIPDDITVLLKLGNNYDKMGEKEAAKSIFSIVLELEPKNSVALEYVHSHV